MKWWQKKNLVEGPLGFPVSEEQAHELELTLNQSEFEYRHLTAVEKVETDEVEQTDVSFITTDSLDRDREVVLASGVKFAEFRKNPIVTFAHRYDELPVGKSLWQKQDTKRGKTGVLAKTKYAKRPEDWDGQWFPSAVWSLVQEGILKGKSIGFLPLEARPPKEADLKRRPDWANARMIYTKVQIWEYAIAPIPANPDALVQQIGKGLDVPASILEELGIDPQHLSAGGPAQAEQPANEDKQPEITFENSLPWIGQKPYPNEHACRQADPDQFDERRRAENPREHDGKKYFVIYGRTADGWEEQSYRYPKGEWSASDAKAHCEAHGGTQFEPAREERQIEVITAEEFRRSADLNQMLRGVDIEATVEAAVDRRRGRV